MAVLESIHTSNEALLEQIRRLQSENESLRKAQAGKLTLKVSEKGAVSVCGMGQWPTTLYAQQWKRVLDAKEQILAFIDAHHSELSYK